MSRFNSPSSTRTTNLAGGEAFQQSKKLEAASILLTSFTRGKFYRSGAETIERLIDIIEKINDKKFVAKAAIYGRNEFGMRSISHVAAAEIVRRVKGECWTRRFITQVIRRVDDMTEIMSYWLTKYGKPIPNSLKKGLADSFGKFNQYQLAKYQARDNSVSLVDVARLVHPHPCSNNSNALELLAKDQLRSEDTWESELTRVGQAAKEEEQKARLKAEVWTRLVKERKIGYFAVLRNLRNILADAPGAVDAASALLKDPRIIRKSLVMPFRYLTAIKEIEQLNYKGTRLILTALNNAVDLACENVPKFEGRTLIALDISKSMRGRVSDIASLFAAIMLKMNDADLIRFNNSAHYFTINPLDSTLTISRQIASASGSTNFRSIFKTANKPYDRIIILSDMQGWVGFYAPTKAFAGWKKEFQCSPKVFFIDLAGYGTMQFPEPEVYCVTGFSEKIFDIIKLFESDKKALIHKIEQVEL